MTFLELQAITAPDVNKNCTLVGSDFSGGIGVERLIDTFFSGGQLVLAAAEQESQEETDTVLLRGTLANACLGVPDITSVAIDVKATFSLLPEEIPVVSIVLSFAGEWMLPEALASSDLLNLKAALNIDVDKKLAFPLTSIELESTSLSCLFTISPNSAVQLSEVGQYIQGAEVVSLFPTDSFPSFAQNLTFNSFGIGARVDPMNLTLLTAEVALSNGDTGWKPFEDLLEFKELKASFLLMNPLAAPTASVDIQATTLIADKEIVGIVSLPSLAFNCFLAEEETIQLKELLELMGIEELPMPEVICDELEVVGDVASSTFELFVGFQTKIELDLIVSTLSIEELRGHFTLITAPERQTGAEMYGRVSIGDTAFELTAASFPGEPGWQFTGGLSEGDSINFGTLITDLGNVFDGVDDRPPVLEDLLELTNLQVAIHTHTKNFNFLCETLLTIDAEPLHLLLKVEVINTTEGYRFIFSGVLTMGTRQLSVVFEKETDLISLIATFQDAEGTEIDLVEDVVGLISGDSALNLDNDYQLTTLELYFLELSYLEEESVTTYGLKGEFAWAPQLGLNSNESETFRVRAAVDLKKEKGSTSGVYGIIEGSIENTIEGLDFLSLAACYEIYPAEDNILKLLLNIGPLPLEATYDKSETSFTFGLRESNPVLGTEIASPSLTLGEVATFFVSLVDPSVVEYEFDPPWDALASIDLVDFLQRFELELVITKPASESTSKNTTAFSIDFNLTGLLPDSLSAFVTINKLSLTYAGNPNASNGKDKKKVYFSIEGEFLGQPVDDLGWDPVNDSAPEVPGQGAALFDLRYLGLGQRVAIKDASNVVSIGEVMDLLRGVIDEKQQQLIADRSLSQGNPLASFGDDGPIVFSPDSEWLIGLDVSLLKVLNLSVIFNDPVIYGLRIELYGKMAKNFAGLKFEILYQKITDDIGKYHIDLTLPDFVRHLTVGAVSVTLPIIVVDIFTNGDFKVDLGFPWNFNFSRSFALEILPFTGAGGFYFNKLSAATATSTPDVLKVNGEPIGVFTPVYEFGLGLKIGLGKTFNYGPLKAEISITVQGLVEGVISWYNPRVGGDKELYYAIRGGIAIVGRLYGEVDFVVVSVSVEVVARASIQFVVESYKDILIKMEAEVSVKAKAKVLFVTVKFTFKLKVEQSFVIDGPQHGQDPPWLEEPGAKSIAARSMSMRSRSATGPLWTWDGHSLWAAETKKELDLFFQPGYSWVNGDGLIPAHAKGEVLLFLENITTPPVTETTEPDSETTATDTADQKDFGVLAQALLEWTLRAGGIGTTENITLERITALYENFVSSSAELFTFEQLSTFLFDHFVFHIQHRDTDLEGTLFPIFPQLSLSLGDTEVGKFSDVDYQLTEQQLVDIKAYFAQLKVQFAPHSATSQAVVETAEAALVVEESTTPITSFIFADYAKIIVRSSLQAAKAYLTTNGTTTQADLLAAVLNDEGFASIPNMASRFLMHGMYLPEVVAGDAVIYEAQPLYRATGQQFDFKDALHEGKYIVKLTDKEASTGFKFSEDLTAHDSAYVLENMADATKIRFPLANTVHILENLTADQLEVPTAKPVRIDYYAEEDNQINFALRSALQWGGTEMLVSFPKSLTAYLMRKVDNPAFTFSTVPISDEQPDLTDEARTAVTNVTFATRIDIAIKKIPNNGERGFLSGIYVMEGTSEAEKDLLEDIAVHLDENEETAPGIRMAYLSNTGSSGSALVDLPATDSSPITIIKTNLSTQSYRGTETTDGTTAAEETPAVSQDYSAASSSTRKFMQFVWEGSTVGTGGFFLSMELTEEQEIDLFAQSDTAQVAMVIVFADAPQVLDFNNCMLVAEVINLEEELLLAQSGEQVPVLRIPAGHIGFKRDRTPAADVFTDVKMIKEAIVLATPADDGIELTTLAANTVVDAINVRDGYLCVAYGAGEVRTSYGWIKVESEVFTMPTIARNELDMLYQLLGYHIENHPLYDDGLVGLPIGPTGEDQWLYERIIPTFDAQAPDSNNLPDARRNPYQGISAGTPLKVVAWWQDLYGNVLDTGEEKEQDTFPISYTDPVIGLNQWPSVSERYQFAEHPAQTEESNISQANLQIELAFDVSPYLVASHPAPRFNDEGEVIDPRKDAINAALTRYEQIYFQLKQADVSLNLHTSLIVDSDAIEDPNKVAVLTKSSAVSEEEQNTVIYRGVIEFIENIYKYLKVAQGLTDSDPVLLAPAYQETFPVTFQDGNVSKIQQDFIFGLNVWVEIKRGIAFIHETLLDSESETGIAAAYENVWRNIGYLSPKVTKAQSTSIQLTSGQSLQALAAAQEGLGYTVTDLVIANLHIPGLLVDNLAIDPVSLVPKFEEMRLKQADWTSLLNADDPVTIDTFSNSTLEDLRLSFQTKLNSLSDAPLEFTPADLAAVLANETSIFVAGQTWRLPPPPTRMVDFATSFEDAFPGLRLAVSEDRESRNRAPDEAKTLFVVQISEDKVNYNILEQRPVFFAIPPLANTLLSQAVTIDAYGDEAGGEKQFDSVDINALARDFLVAVEDFLEPDSLVNAHKLGASDTATIIAQKAELAHSISKLVTPILADDIEKVAADSITEEEAQEAIRQQMLVNLVEGYDVETIIQFDVKIDVATELEGADDLARNYQPRIVGKAKVLRMTQGETQDEQQEVNTDEYDYSLSLGKIPLTPQSGTSYFTYLFDTKTPEKYSNLFMDVEFHTTGIEYNINEVPGIVGQKASDWLTLIRPDNLKQSMGEFAIPIPLRSFPMPPSLVFQRAEPDPSSREVLADVRQWKYTIVFEHPDVAQDKVDCLTKLNQLQPENATATTVSNFDDTAARDTLLESLLNFSQVYPQLVKDLDKLRDKSVVPAEGSTEIPPESAAAMAALTFFKTLVAEVTSNWKDYELPQLAETHESQDGDLHFQISEEPFGDDQRQGFVTTLKMIDAFNNDLLPDPILQLPGYKEAAEPSEEEGPPPFKRFTFVEDTEDKTFFGDSSIPDRKFMIENLDVIPHQNAWASIWLSRNKGLLKNADDSDMTTNPKFVFVTPAVRFNSMVTPVIINDEPWDIATIDSADGSPVKRSLQDHLTKMFAILFPDATGQQAYEVQLSCRYAFALASGLGLNDDLKPTLPVLLGLRLSSVDRSAFDEYPQDLATEINTWRTANNPSPEDASLLFSISLFSKLDEDSNTSLPMLRIERLELKLKDME